MARASRFPGTLRGLLRHWHRLALSLGVMVIALLHAAGAIDLGFIDRLDAILYDARLRATLPRTPDERIVIVDIDEKSLAEVGRWPWGRDRLARLADELFTRQQVALVGFDIVFAEADDSSGLGRLRLLAQGPLRQQPGFAQRLRELEPALDHDGLFARALGQRPVVLGYYFTQDAEGRTSGVLPAPVMSAQALQGRPIRFTEWSGYGANIPRLAAAAPVAGFLNPQADADGVVRSVPLLGHYRGGFYESLSLAMLRQLLAGPQVEPGLPVGQGLERYEGLESVRLRQGARDLDIPVAEGVTVLVPYRGPGGPEGGSFRYVSAADLEAGRLPPGALRGRIVLVGTTAPGLQDLRVTPVGQAYPGVEVHANLLSAMLDGRLPVRPDYAVGYDIVVLLGVGLLLAFALPLLPAGGALALGVAVVAVVVGLNFWLYLGAGLVMPLAPALAMVLTVFGLNMGWGYFVESRHKRELVQLFGTYVPPELVAEMVRDPDSYSMRAASKELTVMFCDMRGFTQMSEAMEPVQLQALLNGVFDRMTDVIRQHRGTIDKYMGDCVMAFWGAPVDTPAHAQLAVQAALALVAAVREVNAGHRARGLPEIGIGIGLNTGPMCVGDMGSHLRRAYTVIGDAVNLASRLEGLSKVYGVAIVASESTRRQAPQFTWRELDKVRVKGKGRAVAIFEPLPPSLAGDAVAAEELRAWSAFLSSYRAQDWPVCEQMLATLPALRQPGSLHALFTQRVTQRRELPFDPAWDGATNFDEK